MTPDSGDTSQYEPTEPSEEASAEAGPHQRYLDLRVSFGKNHARDPGAALPEAFGP